MISVLAKSVSRCEPPSCGENDRRDDHQGHGQQHRPIRRAGLGKVLDGDEEEAASQQEGEILSPWRSRPPVPRFIATSSRPEPTTKKTTPTPWKYRLLGRVKPKMEYDPISGLLTQESYGYPTPQWVASRSDTQPDWTESTALSVKAGQPKAELATAYRTLTCQAMSADPSY